MKAARFQVLCIASLLAILAMAGPAHAALVNYTVGGWFMQFPGPVTPPANAPWGPNGYPGDIVEFAAYTGTIDLTPGTYTQRINTLQWVIDYTYAGTATDPTAWSDLAFDFTGIRGMSLGSGSGSVSQAGHLDVTWDNDYLSLFDGLATTFFTDGYRVEVTPLGLDEVGGTNFSGGNPWTQPSRNVMGRFDVTAVPEPTAAVMIALALASFGAVKFRSARGKRGRS
jgi:hypothetical protein